MVCFQSWATFSSLYFANNGKLISPDLNSLRCFLVNESIIYHLNSRIYSSYLKETPGDQTHDVCGLLVGSTFSSTQDFLSYLAGPKASAHKQSPKKINAVIPHQEAQLWKKRWLDLQASVTRIMRRTHSFKGLLDRYLCCASVQSSRQRNASVCSISRDSS